VALFARRTVPQVADTTAWLKACDYGRIESLQQLDDWIGPAVEAGVSFGCDLETTTLNTRNRTLLRVVGVNLAIAEGVARYVPVGHLTGFEHNLSWPEVLARLKRWDAAGVTSLWYGCKYDHEVLWLLDGWEQPAHFEEVLWAVWLHDCNQKTFGLKAASQRILSLEQPTYKKLTEGRNFADLHPDEAVMYGCSDADCTRRLWFHPDVQKRLGRQRAVYQLEKALLLPFRRCVRNVQYWDDRVLEAIETDLGGEVKGRNGKIQRPSSGRIGALDAEISEANGGPVNFDAPAQIGEMLTRLGVQIEERTDSDQVATGKEVLGKYKSAHPIVSKLIMRRELAAYDRNYVRKLRAAIKEFGPGLRFPFNQLGAPTGRMSAGGEGSQAKAFEKGLVPMNEQSIPDSKEHEYLPDLRAALVANDPTCAPESDPWEIWAVDFSQIELRVAANLSGEPEWIDAFLKGEDIHHRNAQLAYDVRFPRYNEAGHEDPRRKKGKTMGFAVLFGATAATVAEHGGISIPAAEKLLSTFYAKAYTLSTWIERMHVFARAEQKVSTWLGRERPLTEFYGPNAPRWLREKGDREAVNSPIQGGAADVFKIAICRADNLIEREGWRESVEMLLFLHDEVVFRGRRSMRDVILPALLHTMSTIKVAGHKVPYTAEAEVGPNWGAGLKPYHPPASAHAPEPALSGVTQRPTAPPPTPPAPLPRMRYS